MDVEDVNINRNFFTKMKSDLPSHIFRDKNQQNNIAMIQDVVKVVHHPVPNFIQTRWLSRKHVVFVILEQREEFLLYFQSQLKTDAIDETKYMNTSPVVVLLCFLQYVLRKDNLFNRENLVVVTARFCQTIVPGTNGYTILITHSDINFRNVDRKYI